MKIYIIFAILLGGLIYGCASYWIPMPRHLAHPQRVTLSID